MLAKLEQKMMRNSGGSFKNNFLNTNCKMKKIKNSNKKMKRMRKNKVKKTKLIKKALTLLKN